MDRNNINQHVINQQEPTQESTQITLDDFVEYNSSEDAIAWLRLMSREYKSDIASCIYSAIDTAKAVDFTQLIEKWRYTGFNGEFLIMSHTTKTKAGNALKISIVFKDSTFTQYRGVFVKVWYRKSPLLKDVIEILSVQENMSRAKIGRILFESDPVARARVDKSLTNSITCLLNRAKKEIRKLWGF